MRKPVCFIPALMLVLAVGMVTICPGPALAAWGGSEGWCPAEDGDTVWYLGYNGPNNSSVYYRLEHRNPDHDVGTLCDYVAPAVNLSYWWYSHPFDGTTMDGSHEMTYGTEFGAGDWEFCLVYKFGISGLESGRIQIRVYDVANHGDTTGTLLATYDTGTITGSWSYKYSCWTLNAQTYQQVQPGHRLAIQVRNNGWGSLLNIKYECPDQCSHLITPTGTAMCSDEDGDGYGDPASVYCTYSGWDCDDGDPNVHSGITEASFGDMMCNDGVDNDCDGLTDIQDNGCQECQVGGDCTDGDPCTDDVCADYVCTYPNNSAPCDDLDDCTMDDTCSGGTCSGVPLDGDGDGYVSDECSGDDCDDSDPDINPGETEAGYGDPMCSDTFDNDCDTLVDIDDPGCWQCTVPGDCDDYDACTIDACNDHQCAYTPFDCDDSNSCTDDSCDRIEGCENVCNAADYLDPCCSNYACLGNPICDEPPECTVPEDCDDSDACTVDDCVDEACQNTPVTCDDGNSCTDDACEAGTGACENVCNAQDYGDPCCTNYACSGEETCQGPACVDNDTDGYGNPASETCTNPEEDCNDANADINPGAVEICDNVIDDDCDGLVDAADPDCGTPPYPATANAEAASYGNSSLTGSGMTNQLTLLLIPIAAVILLRYTRRKK